jgi:prolyl oligopeptidase
MRLDAPSPRCGAASITPQRLRRGLSFVGLVAALAGYTACTTQTQHRLIYPQTATVEQVDDYHGTRVADPYRWLEDPDAPETKAWVEAENKVTFDYLSAIPAREPIRQRLTKLWDFERYTTPFREGDRYFFSRNDGLQNQFVWYTVETLDAEPRELLNPNTLSADGTIAVTVTAPSRDGRFFGYGLSSAGSDWVEFKVRDVATARDTADHLKWIKFSGMAWTHDNAGFFYNRYEEPKQDNPLTAVNKWAKVYFHRLGTPQDADVLVYERPDEPDWGFDANVSEDGRYLVLEVSQGTERKNRVFYREITGALAPQPTETDQAVREIERQAESLWARLLAMKDKNAPEARELAARIDELRAARAQKARTAPDGKVHGFVELLNDFDAEYAFIGNDGPLFYFRTDWKTPRGRVIAIDTLHPERERWSERVPQTDDTLQTVTLLNDRLVAIYLHDAHTRVRIFERDGRAVRDIDLPGLGTAGGFTGRRADTETFYSYTSYTTPATIFRYDLVRGASEVFRRPSVAFRSEDYETRQVFYTSKDGTRVPMFITHRKGLRLDGNNPTYLYGYGGFNIPLTPSFSVSVAVWLEMGGVLAVANLRGGGEYGKDWHDAGRLKNKQNCFDDFIAAAEWLITNQYTSRQKLAIGGGSNGGLLVAACLTQRPDLFGAALPQVPVIDMLRFHLFTIGWAWVSDYGCSDNAEDFRTQMAYSPLHNIRRGQRYPATLITTGDHDDRVVPAHSFKFAAALQEAQAGDAPVLIRIETRAGHGAGKPTTKQIEEATDRWAFLTRVLDMNVRSIAQ